MVIENNVSILINIEVYHESVFSITPFVFYPCIK